MEDLKEITAPLSGTIIEILVSEGQMIKKGDKLIILESMKMHNEICSDYNGKIMSIFHTPNSLVDMNEVIIHIKNIQDEKKDI